MIVTTIYDQKKKNLSIYIYTFSFFERLWKLCFVAALECNHQHGIMFQHPPLYCVHIIPLQGFCARIATKIICVFG